MKTLIAFLRCLFLIVLTTFTAIEGNAVTMDKKGPAISIIPKPLSMKLDDGTFLLTRNTSIRFVDDSKDVRMIAERLAARLSAPTGFAVAATLQKEGKVPSDAIVLALVDDVNLGPEGYRVSVTKKAVRIEGSAAAGLFYGVQTLFQLLPAEIDKSTVTSGVAWSAPCVRIEDKPRFTWRGMHLDVGRHFFSKDSVKRYIDMIASYKMNTFHWHLTEDQGWRIEIKKYPRLTTVGAWRRETMMDCTPHGGFYTQDEVREIVAYARERFITVVPEIEMPGHSLAALAAYPELSCSGGPFKVGTEWGVVNDVYCAGNEKTFQFLEDVIAEVAALFPGQFFHIGGDECPKLRWNNCKRCQDRMAANGLKNEQELQSYFVKRIEKMLEAQGKRLVGWDEILEGGIAPRATVMSWRGIVGGIEAAKSGHDVVMTPTSYCYFDYYQAAAGEPKAIGGFLPIDTVYAYEPIPTELTADQAKHVLGAQGNVWSEWIPNYRQAEYMAATRMMALSEVVWSAQSHRNFKDFMHRMTPQYKRLGYRDINYRVPGPLGIGGRKIIFRDTIAVITSPVQDAILCFTMNGDEPTRNSPQYFKPIPIKGDVTLKTILVLPDGKTSSTVTTNFMMVDPNFNGVAFNYFQGEWVMVPDMNAMKPAQSGVVFDIGLGSVPKRWDNYGLQFKCTVTIPSAGEYAFYLASDDGSKLFLDDKELINNDGAHGMVEASSKTTLTSGKHKLEVRYFQQGGAQDLNVSIEGPGLPKQPLPPRLLSIH
ncbi:MAG: family 20 glycosylhydrolase [Ignavibacteriales bacterium]|nr:family 20 glycosylhydrolase [Ignavibacteriales bacterium]